MSADLVQFNPPRGSWNTVQGTAPRARWLDPADLAAAAWAPGPDRITLGRTIEGGRVAYADDRHMVTIAGSRAGKTATVLIPNLLEYAGSAVVIDPKGELAAHTAAARRNAGQAVFILDPFGEVRKRADADPTGRLRRALGDLLAGAHFNPIGELHEVPAEEMPAEAAMLADALIVSNDKDPHWTDSSRRLVQAVVLQLLAGSRSPASIVTLAEFFASSDVQADLFGEMSQSDNDAFGALLRGVAATNLQRLQGKEYSSIVSTGDAQLAPLLDLRKVSERSDFKLADLKRRPMTLYLVLPASKMGSHFRWLRLVVTLALAALEREPFPAGKPKPPPVLFVLEEFAALGYMRPIERAAGFVAGFGVKLWTVLQDLPQLQSQYRQSWETFLGNAGVIQAFGVNDGTTEEYLSRRLGNTQYEEPADRPRVSMTERDVAAPMVKKLGRLIEPHEVREAFARETWRQLVMIPNQRPIALFRLPYPDA